MPHTVAGEVCTNGIANSADEVDGVAAHTLSDGSSFYKMEKDVNFTEYQEKAKQTAKYPVIGHAVIYPTLGLTNEAGEVSGKIKKIFRDKEGIISEGDLAALRAELGDVLWYLSQVSTELGLSLDEIAEHNIAKLLDRQARGRIQGDGDNR